MYLTDTTGTARDFLREDPKALEMEFDRLEGTLACLARSVEQARMQIAVLRLPASPHYFSMEGTMKRHELNMEYQRIQREMERYTEGILNRINGILILGIGTGADMRRRLGNLEADLANQMRERIPQMIHTLNGTIAVLCNMQQLIEMGPDDPFVEARMRIAADMRDMLTELTGNLLRLRNLNVHMTPEMRTGVAKNHDVLTQGVGLRKAA